jgi:hypothetical protein
MRRSSAPRLAAAVLSALLGASFVAAPLAAEGVHAHYAQLLERGTYTLGTGDAAEATRMLCLACFGMLDEPPSLADCLTRLAVAQAATGDDEAFSDTFRRVVEVEDRFGAYTSADIAPGMRTAFETEVTARIPVRVLETTRTFARLAPAEEAPVMTSSTPVRPLDPDAASAPAEAAPPPPVALPDPSALDAGERERLARARELLAAARDRGDLDEPAQLAREVADANPGAREAQHLAAVIAYRATRWAEAVRYFRQGGDPGDAAPERLFYFAVSLYEVGEREEAAAVLRRSLPHLEHTPFVRSYESKILGEGSAANAGLSGGR